MTPWINLGMAPAVAMQVRPRTLWARLIGCVCAAAFVPLALSAADDPPRRMEVNAAIDPADSVPPGTEEFAVPGEPATAPLQELFWPDAGGDEPGLNRAESDIAPSDAAYEDGYIEPTLAAEDACWSDGSVDGNYPDQTLLPGQFAGGPGWAGAYAVQRNRAWQWLPSGLIFRQYLADPKAPRLGSSFMYQQQFGWVWDIALGGRVGLARWGRPGTSGRLEGWQLDVEGAGFPRLDLETNRDLLAADFRAGSFLTHGRGRWQSQFGYYHLSSHAGDELLLRNPAFVRVNYVRDELVASLAYFMTDAIRVYGEAGYAVYTGGGARPWELQFGAELSPPRATRFAPTPFAAVHGNLRQEFNFGGYLVVQAGAQWQGAGPSARRLRAGLEYFNGKSRQYEFFQNFEQQIGMGVWYDY